MLGAGFGNFQSAGQAVSLSLVSRSRFAQATTTFYIFFDLGIGLGPYIFGFMVPAAGYGGMYQSLGSWCWARWPSITSCTDGGPPCRRPRKHNGRRVPASRRQKIRRNEDAPLP